MLLVLPSPAPELLLFYFLLGNGLFGKNETFC
jgi:hypothetical protein